MKKITFRLTGVLFTKVTNEKDEEIGTIGYPMIISTKSRAGTDSGKSGIWVGKTTIAGTIIKTDEGEAGIYHTYLTARSFLVNDYSTSIKINGKEVFNCTQMYKKSLYPHVLFFEKNSKRFSLEKTRIFSFTYELKENGKVCGRFCSTRFFSLLPSITYSGTEELSDTDIIYLYAIIAQPAVKGFIG